MSLPVEFLTDADGAELDVLVNALVNGRFDHRERCEACNPELCPIYESWLVHKAGCRACQGDAPLTYGICPERRWFLEEHDGCVRCNPCPHLKRAITEIIDWRDARVLLSHAEGLRELRRRSNAEEFR